MSETSPSLNLLPSALAASGLAWGAIPQSLGRNTWVEAPGSSRVVRLLPPQAPLEEEETAAHSSGYRKERSWGRKRPLCAVQSGGRELLSQDTLLCPGPHPGSGSLVLEVGLALLSCLIRIQDIQQWALLRAGQVCDEGNPEQPRQSSGPGSQHPHQSSQNQELTESGLKLYPCGAGGWGCPSIQCGNRK